MTFYLCMTHGIVGVNPVDIKSPSRNHPKVLSLG